MFSLNVPVPGALRRLANDLQPRLLDFEQVRDDHTLVVKRFPEGELANGHPDHQLATLQERLRPVISGLPAVEAKVTGVDAFEQPPRGDGPVVYLAVESPGLHRIHRTLADAFGVVDGLEGDDYTPHVTLARGGSAAAAAAVEQLREREIEPVTWTVSELVIWDSRHRKPAARFGLPA
ncbi:2'-5' RNA ligase family protein [Halonotius terrestris]|uniref:2'-5' RNA ligase family protein n=1 Tax=Halonotius terrestris TaxID=2487750 RepID=A0A8J8PA06_9EURY|nr:2'-5' RNA ligase family protein [Halonotius terrestris]TQQ83773.1 2'-5' RNA ligase family protein [Halonotius terrestris]